MQTSNGEPWSHAIFMIFIVSCLSTETVLRSVIIFAEGLFEGESHIV